MALTETKQKESVESFRDRLATADEEGHRLWVYPKKPGGKFTRIRTIIAWTLLVILFTLPFIEVNGEPLVMLNFPERKFILFGLIFYPQDFYIFGLGMITFVLFIILFTVIYGRVFCGFACPQTIFLEMVFRKIEYAIEGDWKQQKSLDRQPWNAQKIWKKSLKHIVFLGISFAISLTFLSYIIGKNEVFKFVSEPVSTHIGGVIALVLFTGAFYYVFAFFREQVCTAVCPYGRLQGVLLDRNSMVVAYDYKRGEPRSHVRKGEDRRAAGKGDCIDCHHCADVCPAGIDIRNGTQLECINCTACIDACDFMMKKVGLPKGLIRFTSEKAIAEGAKFRITPRIAAYTGVLLLLLTALISLTALRSDVDVTLLRAPGMLYQEQSGNRISNLYTYKIINKTRKEMPLEFQLENRQGEIQVVGDKKPVIQPEGSLEGSLFIILPEDEVHKIKTKLEVGIYSGDKLIQTKKTAFMGHL